MYRACLGLGEDKRTLLPQVDILLVFSSESEILKQCSPQSAFLKLTMAAVGIFDRVAGLPMVQSTYGKVSEVYSSAKERNSLVNFALSTVEASVQVVATSAQPIVSSLEKPSMFQYFSVCLVFPVLLMT